jgi:transcriptional regulator with XRE-family HTH domain
VGQGMPSLVGATLGERVAELRRRLGMSQKDLATELGRSESWVSQVERDVLPVERVSTIQRLAEALGASAQDLRPETVAADHRPAVRDEMEALRLTLTGHPALGTLLGTAAVPTRPVEALEADVIEAWLLTHVSQFGLLAASLSPLLTDLEGAVRAAKGKQRTKLALLLTSSYQAAAAAFARQDQADAAWLAADRATRWAEEAGDPLAAVASGFRMGHAFLALRRYDQAEYVATRVIGDLRPLVDAPTAEPEALSLYGAMHLLLAVVHAREGDRGATHSAIVVARQIAERLGVDRNDYNTEFGPTNVELHAISTSADLGDAGEAIERAGTVDATGLSVERQTRLAIDLARAHAQRRHVGEAVAALLRAEQLATEQVHRNDVVRQVTRDLLNVAGRRATTDLLDFARRLGV